MVTCSKHSFIASLLLIQIDVVLINFQIWDTEEGGRVVVELPEYSFPKEVPKGQCHVHRSVVVVVKKPAVILQVLNVSSALSQSRVSELCKRFKSDRESREDDLSGCPFTTGDKKSMQSVPWSAEIDNSKTNGRRQEYSQYFVSQFGINIRACGTFCTISPHTTAEQKQTRQNICRHLLQQVDMKCMKLIMRDVMRSMHKMSTRSSKLHNESKHEETATQQIDHEDHANFFDF
jgi:hypothetical protein